MQNHNMNVLINPAKMWPWSNIWEHQQTESPFNCVQIKFH